MTDITIPPEAVEAAAVALYDRLVSENYDLPFPDWDQLDHSIREGYRAEATIVIRVILKAWPGASRTQAITIPHIILPLPQEKSND